MVPDLTRRRALVAAGSVAGIGHLSPPAVAEQSRANPPDTGPPDGNEWPMERRDPAGTGYAPDASGPKDGVRVRWKQPVEANLGFFYGVTPIVSDGLVYGVDRELVCVDAASGEVVFRVDREYVNPPAVAPARAYEHPTLVFDSRRGVDGLDARGGIALAGLRLGLRRWSIERDQGLATTILGGQDHSVPVAAGDSVFVTTGDSLLAIDASSGRVRWRRPGGGYRPAVRDGTVYVASYARGLLGYDVESGERIFSPDDVQSPLSVTAAPERLVVRCHRPIVGVDYDGSVAWRKGPEEFWGRGAIAAANGVAYTAGVDEENSLVAIDVSDGTTLWTSSMEPEQTPQSAPPSVADGVVYVPEDDAGLAAVDAEDGHVRWRFDPGEDPTRWSPAALVGETLYALADGHLYALEEA